MIRKLTVLIATFAFITGIGVVVNTASASADTGAGAGKLCQPAGGAKFYCTIVNNGPIYQWAGFNAPIIDRMYDNPIRYKSDWVGCYIDGINGNRFAVTVGDQKGKSGWISMFSIYESLNSSYSDHGNPINLVKCP